MNSLDYDVHIREQMDTTWSIALDGRPDVLATAAGLEEAVQIATRAAPGGYARVLQQTGRIGVVQLRPAALN